MKLKKILKIVIIICLVVIIIDQASKILIKNFSDKELNIIPNNILTIKKLENKGIAFGLNKQNLGNIITSLIVIIFIFNYIISQKERLTTRIVIYLSFILAGGISNLIDRIFKGAVFDFIKIGEFPVFNIADVCIVIGWFLFLIDFLKELSIDMKTIKNKK